MAWSKFQKHAWLSLLKRNGPPVSKKELENLYKEGMSIQNIASNLNAGKTTVWRWMYFYGIRRRRSKGTYKSLADELKFLYENKKMTLEELSKYFDVPKLRLWRLFKLIDLKLRNPKELANLREEKFKKRPEIKQKRSDVLKRLNKIPGFREYAWSQMRKFPTKPEKKLINLLNINFPSEWKYTGNGQLWIGKKNPDFFNEKTKSHIIEIFGEYWHTVMSDETPEERIAYYKEYGKKCLVLWVKDIKNGNAVLSEINCFMSSKNE